MTDNVERIADLETAKRQARALQASELLQNPLFVEAWDEGHDYWMDRIEEETDPIRRDEIWRALRIFRVVRQHFEKLVNAENTAREINAAAEKQVHQVAKSDRRPGEPIRWIR